VHTGSGSRAPRSAVRWAAVHAGQELFSWLSPLPLALLAPLARLSMLLSLPTPNNQSDSNHQRISDSDSVKVCLKKYKLKLCRS